MLYHSMNLDPTKEPALSQCTALEADIPVARLKQNSQNGISKTS
jgi:hypothetical protein